MKYKKDIVFSAILVYISSCFCQLCQYYIEIFLIEQLHLLFKKPERQKKTTCDWIKKFNRRLPEHKQKFRPTIFLIVREIISHGKVIMLKIITLIINNNICKHPKLNLFTWFVIFNLTWHNFNELQKYKT